MKQFRVKDFGDILPIFSSFRFGVLFAGFKTSTGESTAKGLL
jgi:hypothetical protein